MNVLSNSNFFSEKEIFNELISSNLINNSNKNKFLLQFSTLFEGFIFNLNNQQSFEIFCFLILNGEKIILNLNNTSFLHHYFLQIIQSKKYLELYLSRFCNLLENWILPFFNIIKNQIWFITELISFSNFSSIISFFDIITQNPLLLKDIFNWLISINIDEIIIKNLKKFYKKKNYELINGIYNLILYLSKDQRFIYFFTNPSRIKLFYNIFKDFPIYLQITRLNLLNIFFDYHFNSLISLELIEDIYLNIKDLNQISILSLEIFSKILNYFFIDPSKIDNLLLFCFNIINNNPYNSISIKISKKFIINSLKNQKFSFPILTKIILLNSNTQNSLIKLIIKTLLIEINELNILKDDIVFNKYIEKNYY